MNLKLSFCTRWEIKISQNEYPPVIICHRVVCCWKAVTPRFLAGALSLSVGMLPGSLTPCQLLHPSNAQWRTSQADIFLGNKIISFFVLLGYHGQDDSYSAMGSGNVFANQIRWRKENVIFLMCDVNISLCASGWVHSQHERVEPT